jgi:hypothetical protein
MEEELGTQQRGRVVAVVVLPWLMGGLLVD